MRVGIIGYGSMGKMLLWKFSEAGTIGKESLYVANRTLEKLEEAKEHVEKKTNKTTKK